MPAVITPPCSVCGRPGGYECDYCPLDDGEQTCAAALCERCKVTLNDGGRGQDGVLSENVEYYHFCPHHIALRPCRTGGK
jgi:hypothetical protein